ncbi:MAG: DUF4256 domain-containing protein [Bacteroidia bacterium]|nr:DUF4256 domain-containing protein [Bacteroidia bacterium]
MATINTKKDLTVKQQEELLEILQTRFEKNMQRHKGMKWISVASRIKNKPSALWSLLNMEKTGGEPDVTGWDKKSGEYIFSDCSTESPKGRRSLCYDHKALYARKEFKPKSSALRMAEELGIKILSEEEYRNLQRLTPMDHKSSSWVLTPDEIRKLGGAIFCDRRYDSVFTYHNGADSYYAARGFRGSLRV